MIGIRVWSGCITHRLRRVDDSGVVRGGDGLGAPACHTLLHPLDERAIADCDPLHGLLATEQLGELFGQVGISLQALGERLGEVFLVALLFVLRRRGDQGRQTANLRIVLEASADLAPRLLRQIPGSFAAMLGNGIGQTPPRLALPG